MSKNLEDRIASLVSDLLTDGFNRSLGALEEAGAVDTRKMRKEYCGIGSRYYDMVTEQINLTVGYARARIRKMVTEYEAEQNPEKPGQ